jgi:PIN domain nuclease of toxin-antitoxin system
VAISVLLDTHALLWALVEPSNLSLAAVEIIEDPQNTVVVSSASAWEIAIKYQLGRLPEARLVIDGYQQHLRVLRAVELSVNSIHAIRAGSFEVEHRDPFDRMLASQSLIEGIPLVSKDPLLRQFDVSLIW